ncbi:hypothetical protein CRUP_023602, partial [Coryphaenoides rupestris]
HSYYSAPEVAFGTHWQNSASYIAAVYFHSSMERSIMFMSPLPSRVLKEGDEPPIADLSNEENHTLKTFKWMTQINTLLGGRLVRMWENTMCSVAAREKGRALLEQLVLSPTFVPATFLSIVTTSASC